MNFYKLMKIITNAGKNYQKSNMKPDFILNLFLVLLFLMDIITLS